MELQQNNSTRTHNRKIHMDILRIIAIYLVVFNHTGYDGFFLFSVSQDSPFYIAYLFISIAIKINVPIFWMISGALLLKKEESAGDVIKKRFLRFFAVLFVFSLFQYIVSLHFDFSEFSAAFFFTKLYTGQFAPAYWYLYAYLGYLLMLPLLRKLVLAMRNKDFLYLIALRILLSFLPIAEYIIWKGEAKVSGNFGVQIVSDAIFYPILGYYAENRIPEKYLSKKNTLMLVIISITAIALCCVMTHYRCSLTGDWSESGSQMFHKTLTYISAFSFYILIKQKFAGKNIPNSVSKVITAVSSTTFGIMLTENIVRSNTTQIYNALAPYVGRMLSSMIWSGTVCCICGVIIFVIRQIPFVKKYI